MEISEYNSTQFEIPTKIKNEIISYFKNVINEVDFADPKDLPEYAKNGIVTDKAHVTVLYGIRDNMEEKIKEVVSKRDTISMIFGKTKVFETSFLNYDVLYIEVLSLGIRRLRSALQKQVEYVDSPFSFKPHCTIVYLKKGLGERYKDDSKFEGVNIKLDSLTYSSKDGEEKIFKLGIK